MRYICFLLIGIFIAVSARAYDGAGLWLPKLRAERQTDVTAPGSKDPRAVTAVDELRTYWAGQPVRLELKRDKALGAEGFRIVPEAGGLTLTASEPSGLLYGAYHLLRLQGAGKRRCRAIRCVC